MRFAAIAVTALAGLALAACTGGVISPRNVSGDLKVVTPIRDGTYEIIPSDNEATVRIARHGTDYRMSNAASMESPVVFRVLAMPELPRSRYLIQVDDPDKKTGKLTYHYYFVIIGADQIVVLTPSRHDLEAANLDTNLKPLVTVEGGDEVVPRDPKDTLSVLKLLATEPVASEVIMQFARRD